MNRQSCAQGIRAQEIFLASCERPPEDRTDFLRRACGDNDDLFREVQELLAYKDDNEETVVSPIAGPQVSSRFGDRFAPGTLLDDRYRVEAMVGRGGMGEVYRAEDLTLGVAVALKFLPEWLESEDDMRRRFLEEVKLARAITHPNVCRVYDVGDADGHPFISMEFIDGEDLATRLDKGRLPLAQAVELMRQVTDGLDAAHRQGILHRDLKPSNLMIDTDGQARITDFGLAVVGGSLSGAEVMTGTPAYMAPEQLSGWEVTVQSDLYALGLVFYEMVLGRPAFTSASSLSEVLRIRQENKPAPPSVVVEDLDPSIERLILSLLEENPDQRPESARDVLAALPGGGPPVLMTLVVADGISPTPNDHDGIEVGDGAWLFERPWSAVSWALAFPRGCGGRTGVHLTEVVRLPGSEPRVDADALELARNLAGLARQEQILLTRGAFDLARQASDGSPSWLAHGAYRLPGPEEPVEIFEVGHQDQAPLAAPEGSRQVPRVTQVHTILGWRPAAGQAIEARPGWRLERQLGEGGYGEVWLASKEETGERRAFKFCFEARRLRALKREITLFRLLKEGLGDRDDIARILDWNFETVPYFIESEYTSGGDLKEWAQGQGGLREVPLEVRLSIIAQTAEALSAAHSVGVLHKDVKPGNILIHLDREGRPHPRLADFGIGLVTDETRAQSAELTLVEMTVGPMTETEGGASGGTPIYRAPELLEGKRPTLQADVYALGVTLYQMVVGDFQRALGPGWERDVDDKVLREDIADAVDKSPRRRLGNAIRLAERLSTLDERRRQRQAERQAREEATRAREELRRARRRRKLVALVMVALAIFAGAMWWQAMLVRREAERANREAVTARQVADFLVRLFEVSDPGSGHGKDVKAREILDLGAVQAQSELREQPDVRARMMRTIGVVYRSLGLYENAAPLLEDALSSRRGIWGEEHAEIAESLDDLAVLAREEGEYEKSESLGREALNLRQRLLGEEHLDVAASLNTLAGALSKRGEYDEAEKLYRQALDMRKRLLGGEHADVAENLNSLAEMFRRMGNYETAESLYRDALEMRKRLLGDEHPDLARSLHNLGVVLKAKGDYRESERYYREALEMRQHLLGDEHPDLARSLSNLAQVLQLQGKLEEAEPLYIQALEMRQRLLGDDHPDVANSLISLGWLFMARGDFDASEDTYRKALELRRNLYDGDHDRIASSLNHLAGILRAKGDLAAAEPLYREALDMHRRLWGSEHRDLAYDLDNIAGVLESKGDAAGAEGNYREALDMRRRLLRKKHPEIARSLIQVARIRSVRGDFHDAETLTREALEILHSVFLPDHWRIAEAQSRLGVALAGLEQWAEAEAMLLGSYTVLMKQIGEKSNVTQVARKRLADFYEARGENEKSAFYRNPPNAGSPRAEKRPEER